MSEPWLKDEPLTPEPWKTDPPADQMEGNDLMGGALTVLQGASLGLADEVIRLRGNALAPGLGDVLVRIDKDQREAFSEDHPKSALGLELAGGFATGGGGGLRVAGSKMLAKAPGPIRHAIAGAIPGAIAGAGYAEENRVSGALQGAALGAGVGAIAPSVGQALGGAVRSAGNAIAAPFRGARTQALRQINQAFQRDQVTPTRAARTQAVLGEEASLADIGGANVRGLAESAANQPGRARNQGERFLRDRQQGQRGRLIDMVKSRLSSQAEDFDQATEEIVTRMRTQAAPLYAEAYQAPFENTEGLQRLLQNPQVKPLLKKAIKNAQSDVTLDDAFKAGLDPENPNLIVWDYVKRALADRSFKKGGNEGRILKGIEKQIIKELDDQVPQYEAARKVWSDNAKQLEALEKGKAIFADLRRDPDFAIKEFEKLSDDQKELFRLGAGRTLINLMRNVDDTLEGSPPASLLKQIFGSPAKREALRAIFPGQQEFRQFARALRAEQTFHRNTNQILANSRTATRQAGQEDMAVDIGAAADAAEALSGNLRGITGLLRRIKPKSTNPEMDKELAERFFTKDADAIRNTLTEMQEQGQLLPKTLRAALVLEDGPLLEWLRRGKHAEQLADFIAGGTGATVNQE